MKNLCFIAAFLTLSTHAQSYFPAGLGNANLQLWLTAADPSTVLNPSGTQAANGDFIQTWKDKSGRGADAAQLTGGSQPVYQTGVLNGLGAVVFQYNTQYLTGPAGTYQTIVATRALYGNSYQYLFSSPALADYSVRTNVGENPGNIYYTQGPNGEDWDAWDFTPNTYLWLNGVQTLQTSSATHILVDEAPSAINGTYSVSNLFSTRGMYDNDAVYELMAYNGTPNSTQRILLENYQASEWGLTSSLPSGGYTIFIPPTSTTYNQNLVGIGNSGSDNFLTDAAGSTDGFGLSSGSTGSDFLGSAGYVMAAHNGQSNTVNYNPTLSNVPIDSYVWNRSWYMQQFAGNSAGNLTLMFNFNDYNGTSPDPTSSYALLYNPSDGTFASGTNTIVSTVSTIASGNTVSFTATATNLPNGYYTIVYQPVILPITLDNFLVTRLSPDAALAKWTVDPGSGWSYFALQHSTDGQNFTSIGSVPAASTNNTANYSYTDKSPSQGLNYYRLAMIDAIGATTYSPIDILTFGESAGPVTLYPVPAKDILHISAPGITGARTIDLISATGRLLESHTTAALDGANISVSRLPTGAYFVRIRSGGQPLVIPFLKE